LGGSLKRHLGRPVQGLQQARDMCFVVHHTELLFNHRGYTGAQVQSSPRNLYASAPWDKNSGSNRNSLAVSFGGLCPGGLARQAVSDLSILTIHWLTAAFETPKASAISLCFHPCSFSSKARLRRASSQSLKRYSCDPCWYFYMATKVKLLMQRSVS